MGSGSGGASGGVADEHGQVTEYPRGFVPAWGLLFGGAVALVVFHLVQQPAGSAPPLVAPRPGATVTVTASPGVSASSPAAPRVSLPAGGQQPSTGFGAGASISRRTRPPAPAPSPSQSPEPQHSAVVGDAIVVPLRGATPVAVCASVVAPSAPPFPQPSPAIGVTLQLPGLTVTALP